jgi:hypothetical protein
MKGLTFSSKITSELTEELGSLAEQSNNLEEVLSEVDRIIEARYFNSERVILGQGEMSRWLWWEKARRIFAFMVNDISPAPF